MKRLLPLLLLGSVILPTHARLVINELMQSNIDCVFSSDLNDYPDSWIEIWNDGKTAVNLGEYYLSETPGYRNGYRLPQQQVAAGEHLLVYCDREATGLHTPFRLDTDAGGSLYLYYNNILTDHIDFIPAQPAPNIAYGRRTDGAGQWGYMPIATPGAANQGGLATTLLPEPLFSVTSQVFSSAPTTPLIISLPSTAPQGSYICYTTDGSEPTRNNGTRSSSNVQLSLSGTLIVRAKLCHDTCLSRPTVAHSYIVLGRQTELPIVSISTAGKNFYDAKMGIYVEGSYDKYTKNYQFNWRRPISLEYFPGTDIAACIRQLCETRVQGGATRVAPLKSLAIYAHKRFGEKRLRYVFFPDQRPESKKFKSILLRNAGNDFDYLYMRDAIIQRAMAAGSDIDWQAWQPAIVYINGVYKGLLNLRERSNEDNIYTHYNDLEDIDLVEGWNEAKVGTSDNWKQFVQFYTEHGHSMAEFEQWIDCREFLNIMIMNTYFDNRDFPGNNITFWRPRTATTNLPARWRVLAKDTDFGLGLYNQQPSANTIYWLYNPGSDPDHTWANGSEHTLLFRHMMEDGDLQREFVDRAAIYVGDFLKPARIRELWNTMYALIQPEYGTHRALYNRWWPNYQDELTWARQWLQQRPDYYLEHVRTQYNLPALGKLQINTQLADTAGLQITFNGVPLTRAEWSGRFYRQHDIRLQAHTSTSDKRVVGWRIGRMEAGNISWITQVSGDSCTTQISADAEGLYFEAITESATGLSNRTDGGIKANKVLENGQVIIRRNAKRYDVLGRELP